MNPRRILFLLASDPRQSTRPAEAVRLAAGISVWRKVEVRLYLRGPAVLILEENPWDLKDEENFRRYLPLWVEQRWPIYVERGSPWLKEISRPAAAFTELGIEELADLAATSQHTAYF